MFHIYPNISLDLFILNGRKVLVQTNVLLSVVRHKLCPPSKRQTEVVVLAELHMVATMCSRNKNSIIGTLHSQSYSLQFLVFQLK